MTTILLQEQDISIEKFGISIEKLKHMQASTELLKANVSGTVLDLIVCGNGKFILWRNAK